MALTGLVWNVGISLVQFFIGLVLAIFSVYLGITILDSLTKRLDEWRELQKGNVAVGILVGAVILSVAVIVESGVSSIFLAPPSNGDLTFLALSLVASLINILIGIVAAMIGIYFAITVFDQLTGHIDEFSELRKGNVAVAIVLGAVLLAVSFVIRGSVDSLITALDVASFLGV